MHGRAIADGTRKEERPMDDLCRTAIRSGESEYEERDMDQYGRKRWVAYAASESDGKRTNSADDGG